MDPVDNISLRILILWALNEKAAKKLATHVNNVAENHDIVKVPTRPADEPDFERLSNREINASDCIFMVAADEDWEAATEAFREYSYFKVLLREGKKRSNQFRFVQCGDRVCPKYSSAGLIPLRIHDIDSPTDEELEAIKAYIDTERRLRSGNPIDVPFSVDDLAKPNGLLLATLWLATLDERLFQEFPASDGHPNVPDRALTRGLQHLKALHSVHSGLGPTLAEAIHTLRNLRPPSGAVDVALARRNLWPSFRRFSGLPITGLDDCVVNGLEPVLRAILRRMSHISGTGTEQQFIAITLDRLHAILNDDACLPQEVSGIDGRDWLDGYQKCLGRVTSRSGGFFLGADLVRSCLAHENCVLKDTIDVSRALYGSVLSLSLMVTVIFSFIHAHRPNFIEDLCPRNVEAPYLYALDEWFDDGIVVHSNNMIVHVLRALEKYEGTGNATA